MCLKRLSTRTDGICLANRHVKPPGIHFEWKTPHCDTEWCPHLFKSRGDCCFHGHKSCQGCEFERSGLDQCCPFALPYVAREDAVQHGSLESFSTGAMEFGFQHRRGCLVAKCDAPVFVELVPIGLTATF